MLLTSQFLGGIFLGFTRLKYAFLLCTIALLFQLYFVNR